MRAHKLAERRIGYKFI